MYQSHWGLDETPFQNRPNARFFYQSPTHDEALARLHFLVDHRRRLGLLMGSEGSGKSLLLDVFADQMRESGKQVAKVSLLGVDRLELLWLLADELSLNLSPGQDVPSLWRAVTDRIIEYGYQQLSTAILLDDADRADEQVLTLVSRLAQFDARPESRVTIVLAGRPEQIGRLGEMLLELIELRIDVQPWDQGDTENYIKDTLGKAGRRTPLFADEALQQLHELGHGIPRRISQLADLALLAGAGRDLKQIDADTVESVYHELGVIEV